MSEDGPVKDHSAGPDSGSQTDPLLRIAAVMLIAVLAIFCLWAGAGILVPVAEAVLVWFVLNALAQALLRAPLLGRYLRLPHALALAAVLVLILGCVAVWSGARSALDLRHQSMFLENSLDPLLGRLAQSIGADQAALMDRALEAIGVESLLQQLVLGLLALINQFGIVAIYVGFLLADQALFPAKMRALFPDPARRAKASAMLSEFAGQINSYLWVMTRVSALTALLSYGVMLAVGLNNAGFWALLVFVLNFIPSIGSILGTALPSIFALLQFPDLQPAFLLCLALAVVQFSIGNILFPRIAGETLNLSFFVTILCLFVWGALWGITGMFLAVPLTAILVLGLSRFSTTRPLAILMSKSGKL